MGEILKKSEKIILRPTEVKDLDFIINAEREKENAQYVGQWSKEKHVEAFSNKDILHLVIEDVNTNDLVGYLIMAGIESKNNNIELKRIVICKKNEGFGRETLKLVKELSFNELGGHRLWLDARIKNKKAINIYRLEGFKEEGVLRECVLYEEKYESIVIMSILESEYRLS